MSTRIAKYREAKRRHNDVVAVRSNAVVKYAPTQLRVTFNQLKCNTDLNTPPSNWLTSTSDSSLELHRSLYQKSGFASFLMADQFPDCVGKVDVVSEAENIKQLLKLPYADKAAISMIVHKVGNTLLLDEFDVQKYMMRDHTDHNWEWLRKFLNANGVALGQKDLNYSLHNKTRAEFDRMNLLSKFMYYSTSAASDEGFDEAQATAATAAATAAPSSSAASKSTTTSTSSSSTGSSPCRAPVLPEPKLEENVPDPKASNRKVLWTFEDIRMLIGSDMPIFGGLDRPCISLRLRDMAQPINVLTGIDYWLDNLMCNVPEVLMCYHLNGIVKKYEVIKTEDLPHLENSQFSPQVVRDVAQNILSFLNANATKAGHTYWLFKGRNEDVVKLYDLSTLVEKSPTPAEGNDRPIDNPFTVPVGMLLYTVARNMKNAKVHSSAKTAGNIRALLESCIKLLPKEQHPQIVTSSHYILSDLFVPAYVDPKQPQFEDTDDDSDATSIYDDDEREEDDDPEAGGAQEMNNNVEVAAVQTLAGQVFDLRADVGTRSRRKMQAPEPLVADTVERCLQALQHVNYGLLCLQFSNDTQDAFVKETEERAKNDEQQRIVYEEQNPTMAKMGKAIPLPYERLSDYKRKSSLVCDSGKEYNTKLFPATSIVQQLQEQPSCSGDSNSNNNNNNNKNDNNKNKKKKNKQNEKKTGKKSEAGPKATAATKQPKLTTKQIQQQVAVNFNSQQFGSWNTHLKLLLLEKACLTYATLGEHCYAAAEYGKSLKAIHMAYRCQHVIVKHMRSTVARRSCMMGRAGDCFFEMYKDFDHLAKYRAEYNEEDDYDKHIVKVLEIELENEELTCLMAPAETMERIMLSSCECYEIALEMLDVKSSETAEHVEDDAQCQLLRRLGNIRNELGVRYMEWATHCANNEGCNFIEDNSDIDNSMHLERVVPERTEDRKCKLIVVNPLAVTLSMKALHHLQSGIEAFKKVNDPINLAFLYSNMGRYLRFRAHLQLREPLTYLFQKELGEYYAQAFGFYEQAKSVLGTRDGNECMWDLIHWEYSTATYMLACHMQDKGKPKNADRSELSEMERIINELLHKAIGLCESNKEDSTRSKLYKYRMALLHKRFGTFHYNTIVDTWEYTTKHKSAIELGDDHFAESMNIFRSLNEFNDEVRTVLHSMSLLQSLSERARTHLYQVTCMQKSVDICLTTTGLITIAIDYYKVSDGNPLSDPVGKYMNAVGCLVKTLQNLFKCVIKKLMTSAVDSQDTKLLIAAYSEMYRQTWPLNEMLPDLKMPVIDKLISVVTLFNKLYEEHRVIAPPDKRTGCGGTTNGANRTKNAFQKKKKPKGNKN